MRFDGTRVKGKVRMCGKFPCSGDMGTQTRVHNDVHGKSVLPWQLLTAKRQTGDSDKSAFAVTDSLMPGLRHFRHGVGACG
jgi:hypothetical protein